MKIEEMLNQEIPIKFNIMLYELFKNTKGFLIVQETENSFDLTFKLPLPKDKTYIKPIEDILEQIVRFKGQ